MAFMSIQDELKIALAEIGPIEPWWSDEDDMFVFEHAAYPWVMHADADKEEVKKGYIRALTGFIEERLSGTLAPKSDETTPGRGGFRQGSGRPKGTKKEPKKRVYLPIEVADWILEDDHLSQVQRLMQA
jgi:hypothetical protein